MTGGIDSDAARSALIDLPAGAGHGEPPDPGQVYLPPSHLKAMDPDAMLVTGMRGAGKTFWWTALQDPAVREFVYRSPRRLALSAQTVEVRTGFGARADLDRYPDRDVLKALLSDRRDPATIWRAVQAWQIAPDDHPIRREPDWRARTDHAARHPEAVARLFQDADARLDREGKYLLLLFDALDRCSDNWSDMYRLVRGLMLTALDMRACRRLRIKMFLRTDQVDESRIADFPDALRVFSTSVALGWPAGELYGLLWQHLVNRPDGRVFRDLLGHGAWSPVEVGGQSPGATAAPTPLRLFQIPRKLIADDESQRRKFHVISGPWMGQNARRGVPYTWIPNRLADTAGQVSPRSFLQALREAALDTAERYPGHEHALHFESIRRGVRRAYQVRLRELREDYPWMERALGPLAGLSVPCAFSDIRARWKEKQVIERLTEEVEQGAVGLPPLHLEDGPIGLRRDLESLGVFQRLYDGRVNLPDVFRMSYGLGRKGGVKPAR